MKHFIIVIVCCLALFCSSNTFAQKVNNDILKVWGNCGMCKKTIEKAAKSAGAKTANWDAELQQLIVSYKSDKTSNFKIQQAVAESGYDTQNVTASDEAYNQLHGCCKYERKSIKKEN
jgi:mercuric ion binding protein